MGVLLCSAAGVALAVITASSGAAQGASRPTSGKDVFRFDTFGNETFWSDTLRLHEIVEQSVDPTTALVWSQVLLSFGVPFALVPLIWLTRRRDVMRDHVTHPLTTAAATVAAVVIIALNVVLMMRIVHVF